MEAALTLLRTTLSRAVLSAAFGLAIMSQAQAVDISGAGATFPNPIYAKWAEAYKAKTGVGLNYQSIGSGGGIKQIQAKTVDFGASDVPQTPEWLETNGMIQFPMIGGGIVPVINVEGVKPGELKLTGKVIADIYLGKITKWNDAAIAGLNSGVKLPDLAIAPVYRSDGSGTTYNFADYLAKQSPEWKDKVGVNTALEWPTGLGGKGNEGVAALAARTTGAIGYVEYAYAKQNKLTYTLVQNKEGQYPQPSLESFQAAGSSADWAHAPGFRMIVSDAPGKDSWPIAATSFILIYKTQEKPETAKAVLGFFDWAYKNGQDAAKALDYVPIAPNVVSLVETSWRDQLKGADGSKIWTGN
jgi:phosphate transport system substrate-binding protein